MAIQDQLLNHFKEKFGIVTVVNATFYDVDDNTPKISFDTLKMSNITAEGQMKEIRGGQGAELLLQYDFGRTVNVEITDALVSMGSLEYLMGGPLTPQGTTINYSRQSKITFSGTQDQEGLYLIPQPADYRNNWNSVVIALTDNKVLIEETADPWIAVPYTTISGAPETTTAGVVGALKFDTVGHKVYELTSIDEAGDPVVYTYNWTVRNGNAALTTTKPTTTNMTTAKFYASTLDLEGTVGNEFLYRYSTTQLAVTDENLPAQDSMEFGVANLFYEAQNTTSIDNHVQEMILKATDFPPTLRMVGETIVLDADKGQKIAFQIEIPKLKLNSNFTLTLDAEGDPSVFDFSGVALSHNGVLMIVRQLGVI
jgi:hypothetical protein